MVLVIPIQSLNALAWTMFSIAAALTFGRFYLRWSKTKRFYLDDLFNALALASLLVFLITYQIYLPIQYNGQLYALGLGGYLPTDEQLLFATEVGVGNVAFFWVTVYCVKACFLALYWNIFGVSTTFRKAWYFVAAYTVLSFLVTFLAVFWQCGTPQKINNLEACNTLPQNTLVTLEVMWCVLHVVGDILAMGLPLAMIRNMHISVYQKWGLGSIAGLVIIDILFDILRTVYTIKVWSSFPNGNAVWALCEPTIAVMICALPVYRSLLSPHKLGPTTSYPWLQGTKSNQSWKNVANTGAASVPIELDTVKAYSLNSTHSVRGHS